MTDIKIKMPSHFSMWLLPLDCIATLEHSDLKLSLLCILQVLNSAIVYDRDYGYNYFGFKVRNVLYTSVVPFLGSWLKFLKHQIRFTKINLVYITFLYNAFTNKLFAAHANILKVSECLMLTSLFLQTLERSYLLKINGKGNKRIFDLGFKIHLNIYTKFCETIIK